MTAFPILSTRARSARLVLAGLALAVILAVASPAQPAAASCGGTTIVSTEAELNSAIAAYNAVNAGPCVFTIQLTANINLMASTTSIQNATSNVSLVIEGAGYTVDGNGQNTPGVRPFALASSNLRPVTFNQITITGGYVPGASGGGIQVQNGDLTVTNSTISGNRADSGGGISFGSVVLTRLTVQNSTISGNRADSGFGGGILVSGRATIDGSTIVDNQAVSGGGGALGATGSNANATVTNSILANSTVPGSGSGVADCAVTARVGTVADGGYNLVETAGNCSFTATGSITGQDPALGPLANNGGPTQTHALQTGSPALDAGNTALTTDQRGYGRPAPAGGADDIGAYEKDATPLAVTLAGFDAAAQAGHVLVTWETVSELENSGFNLYRTDTSDPPAAADLLAFVPSQGPGSAQGFFYSHDDYDVTTGQAYWYWLEDVDFRGATSMHGPVSVIVTAPTAVTLSGLEAAVAPVAWPWWLAAVAAIAAALVAAGALQRRRSNA